jgi:hypothetical protein
MLGGSMRRNITCYMMYTHGWVRRARSVDPRKVSTNTPISLAGKAGDVSASTMSLPKAISGITEHTGVDTLCVVPFGKVNTKILKHPGGEGTDLDLLGRQECRR